jgi:hypothetical protein
MAGIKAVLPDRTKSTWSFRNIFNPALEKETVLPAVMLRYNIYIAGLSGNDQTAGRNRNLICSRTAGNLESLMETIGDKGLPVTDNGLHEKLQN